MIRSSITNAFEMRLMRLLESYLGSSDLQLGFKKRLPCSNAIFAAKSIVEHFIKFASTVKPI